MTFDLLVKNGRGVAWVIVNGVPIMQNGRPTGAIPGRFIRA